MKKNTFMLICLLLVMPVHAAIVDLGSFTRDTETNLDWLDLTFTYGMSRNEVQTQFAGWRYATFDEVEDLFGKFGQDQYVSFNNMDPVIIRIVDIVTGYFGDNSYVYYKQFGGMLAAGEGGIYADYNDVLYTSQMVFDKKILLSAGSPEFRNPVYGAFLVRPSAVPVPAAFWLFSSAMLGLGAVKRKR
jgi:hypothetical protein